MSTELQNALLYIQIIISVLVVISILLQNRAEGLGKMFGGGGEVFRTKRGLEKFLYYFTIALVVLLVITSLLIYKYSV
ncbi:MAG TPA: preprotein translocase subunit SecG [Candidatus Dojkabacteria bacterium]|jgi:preprotein translocase subunit SecG|nr:preprotein translocase subunit SecG [Candidatus Dojkabacteria bacterium]HPM13867.1 preprotein translocase subunit SecG [Candidatus Dojkabacteria bacterium]HQA87936.1 preprotein translocase subunit SecG [Candidatus Dojkabacteria bacterium]